MPVRPIRQKRIYQQIAEQLFSLMADGEFAVDEKLPGEHELARQLGVSRPSVREALIVLEAAGVIEIINGAGSFVRPTAKTFRAFPWEQVDSGPGPLEQFYARYLLEPQLAEEAAKFISRDEITELERLIMRIDELIAAEPRLYAEHMQFHEKVASAARNPFLTNVVRELLTFSRSGEIWKNVRARVDDRENLEEGQRMRRQLVAALKKRDGRAARAALKRHFLRIGKMCFGDDFEKSGASTNRAPRVRGAATGEIAEKRP